MTGDFVLDWAVMAVSLFNTILLFWLGLTVLLNAERRPLGQALHKHPGAGQSGQGSGLGVWLAAGGLLLGGAFFVSHSAILGHSLAYIGPGLDFWWRVGWIPLMPLPFIWYATILWYTGLWREGQMLLPNRHLAGLALTAAMAAGSAGLLIFANPIPSFTQVTQLKLVATPAIAGIPLLFLIYPLYVVLCIGLALDALRRPIPPELTTSGSAKLTTGGSAKLTTSDSTRYIKTVARRRARPWLVTASIALMLAGALVAWVLLRLLWNARVRPGTIVVVTTNTPLAIGRADLAISALIAVATVALGQALVAYEVFTGKTLPRRGLRRYWHNAIVLAAGYGVAVGWSLTFGLRAVYTLLLSALLVTMFYALLSWRSYAERERTIAQLRPFLASQRLYEGLLTDPSAPSPVADATTPFFALCEGVLDARLAYLIPLGPLAPLAGPPLTHPAGAPVPSLALAELARQFPSPQTVGLPVDPASYGGATWAVPLWSERGLIGALLLGEKTDGGLYTQEEIEIARASGERLIDAQASAEMARRLMALQRQRLAESQVLDRRARRALHDDVLPHLHTAMLTLSSSSPPTGGTEGGEDVIALLTDVHRRISDLLHEMPTSTAPQVSRLGLFGALEQAIDDEFSDAFDRVTWRIEPQAEREAQRIPSLTAEVIFYAAREAVRNAARHARDQEETHPLYLDVFATWRNGLCLYVEDNGVGFGAAEPSGGGSRQGLALHGTMMAVVGGSLAVESAPGTYTRAVLMLPTAAKGEFAYDSPTT